VLAKLAHRATQCSVMRQSHHPREARMTEPRSLRTRGAHELPNMLPRTRQVTPSVVRAHNDCVTLKTPREAPTDTNSTKRQPPHVLAGANAGRGGLPAHTEAVAFTRCASDVTGHPSATAGPHYWPVTVPVRRVAHTVSTGAASNDARPPRTIRCGNVEPGNPVIGSMDAGRDQDTRA
jgi:hypothetical protein